MCGSLMGYQSHEDHVAAMSKRQLLTRKERLANIDHILQAPETGNVKKYLKEGGVSTLYRQNTNFCN